VSGAWDARGFSQEVDAVIAPLADQPEALAAFFDRLGTTVLERAKLAVDVFRPAQAGAALAVSLLPHVRHQAVGRQARLLQIAAGTVLIAAGKELASHLKRERYALLGSSNGGLSELFYLPLRVANVLGWTGAAPLMFDATDPRRTEAEAIFAQLLSLILEHYSRSVTTMSDAQASCWTVALSTATLLGLTDEAEQLAGLLYNSLIGCKGKIARGDIPAHKVLDYLIARQRADFAPVLDLVERPDETTAVLLKAAPLLDLQEVFDRCLWELDGHAFSAYLNCDFTQFGAETMNGGENLVWTVGHNIFRVGDLVANWPATTPRPHDNVTFAGAVLASLLYPDRTPWFLLEESAKAVGEGGS
jgi:hypothetical protein